jgi:hypothetical protein
MKRLILAGALIAAGLVTSADLSACGDKFLIVSRGTRFQRASVARISASILVYANPSTNMTKALANVPVESVLRKAGYKPTVVTSNNEFESALNRGGWDLVVLDLAEGPKLIGRMRAADGPAVLPVAYNPSGDDLANARKQFSRVLKSPTKSQPFLDAVDEALGARLKTKGSPKAD